MYYIVYVTRAGKLAVKVAKAVSADTGNDLVGIREKIVADA